MLTKKERKRREGRVVEGVTKERAGEKGKMATEGIEGHSVALLFDSLPIR